MSYPYGPEPYPTWDELERWHDDFRTALYAEHEHACETMLERKREQARNRPLTVNITIDGQSDTDADTLADTIRQAILNTEDDDLYLTEQEEREAWGIAFAHAIGQTGIDSDDMNRLFQDLCNILEDRVVGKVNEEAREREKALWEEDRRRWESQRNRNEADKDVGGPSEDPSPCGGYKL